MIGGFFYNTLSLINSWLLRKVIGVKYLSKMYVIITPSVP